MSSAIGSGIGLGGSALGWSDNAIGVAQIGGAGLSGGITSTMMGGSFIQGLGQGLVVGALNHAAHGAFSGDPDPPIFEEFFNEWLCSTKEYGETLKYLFAAIPGSNLSKLLMFYTSVKTNSIVDIKNSSFFKSQVLKYTGWEELPTKYNFLGESWNLPDLGNYNFGVFAKAFGYSKFVSQAGAGAYQIYSETSSWSFYNSYFDDPRDTKMIKAGYGHY